MNVFGPVFMGCCGYLLPLLATSRRRHLKVWLPALCIVDSCKALP